MSPAADSAASLVRRYPPTTAADLLANSSGEFFFGLDEQSTGATLAR